MRRPRFNVSSTYCGLCFLFWELLECLFQHRSFHYAQCRLFTNLGVYLLWEASSWWPLNSFRMGLGRQMSTPWISGFILSADSTPTPNSREGKETRNIQPLMASELSNCAKMMKSQKKFLKNGISRAVSWWTHQGSDEGHPGRELVCSWVWLYIIIW